MRTSAYMGNYTDIIQLLREPRGLEFAGNVLSKKHYKILSLHLSGKKQQKTIARRLRMTPISVSYHFRRAVYLLRDFLNENGIYKRPENEVFLEEIEEEPVVNSIEAYARRHEAKHITDLLLGALDERACEVARRLFMENMSLRDVGAIVGLSRERVRQISLWFLSEAYKLLDRKESHLVVIQLRIMQEKRREKREKSHKRHVIKKWKRMPFLEKLIAIGAVR